jgi:hypothetical protein
MISLFDMLSLYTEMYVLPPKRSVIFARPFLLLPIHMRNRLP